MSKYQRGIHELYAADPERADALIFGRGAAAGPSRRKFLSDAGALLFGSGLRAAVPYARFLPAGVIPAAFAQSDEPFEVPGKDGRLIVLNDRPINAETPAHLLDEPVTSAERLFVRNNGIAPAKSSIDLDKWTLSISGESCLRERTFTLRDLKRDFEAHTYQLQLECAGNGRQEFNPPASGNQWSVGAVGCPRWTGARLRDVLEACGIRDDAVYVGYHSNDAHLSGDPSLEPISRGVTIAKALEDESLIAWAMNGEDIPEQHGYPLRLVCGGWPGSVSGKWLQSLVVRDRIHDGEKMLGESYRVPCKPVAPGADVAPEDMCIIESMPVKSIVTAPRSGISHPFGEDLVVSGHAWAGDLAVASLRVSIDFGQTWQPADLGAPVNRLAWQHWTARMRFPLRGYYEIWAVATDSLGRSQPMVVPAWNPRGYLNNAAHRIAVQVV